MIERLVDLPGFRRRRRDAWLRNVDYWLAGDLRHVVDVGPHIIECVGDLCRRSGVAQPAVLDMGFGSGWLVDGLRKCGTRVSYIGVDTLAPFVTKAQDRFGALDTRFVEADLETDLELGVRVDVAVNAFSFFELCDLSTAMRNAGRHLSQGGRLFMSTIDKTYLILALSRDWSSFHENLRRYQELEGVKFGFQQIDLGDGVSESLEYPSVLYSTQDYIDAARACGLELRRYEEQAFTGRTVPKIYCHLEFEKVG